MIQITIDEHSPFGRYLIARAELDDQNPADLAKKIIQEQFDAHVRALHARFMQGEFSQGKLADMLDLPRIELIHLLEALGLNVTNV